MLGTIGIIMERLDSYSRVNEIIHRGSDIVVGRLGIPYRQRGVAVISLVVDGSNEAVSAMTGALGKLDGVTVKAAMVNV